MKNNQYFMGYADAKELLETHDTSQPVFVIAMKQSQPVGIKGASLFLTTEYIFISDIQDGVCRYAQIPMGSYQCWGAAGEPFEKEKADQTTKRTDAAEKTIRDIIAELYECKIQQALPATPKDHIFLNGGFSLLKYDKETDSFFFQPESIGQTTR